MNETTPDSELIEDNRRHWDERVPINIRSTFYDIDGFRAGHDDFDD